MPFTVYIRELGKALKVGNATEHTHRPALKALIESVAPALTATNEPKRVECGAPDFIVTKGHVPIGYIEAKDVGKSLDDVQEDEQLTRYRSSLRNLILTNYLEFRYFRNGEPVTAARVAALHKNGVLKTDPSGVQQVARLLSWFVQADVEAVATPRELAQKMASIARMIRELIARVFTSESDTGELHHQYDGFKQVLIADLTPHQFADMYAQTICYGLFAARCNHQGKVFDRESAVRDLPKTNPFLRKVFQQIAGVELDDRIAWAVDDLALLLARCDIAAILEDFGKHTQREDPVVHFYETFLAAYDPQLRETRGVYYTPEPVVDYIVRSIDLVLQRDFKLEDGLADTSKVKVQVGTGKSRKRSGKETEAKELKEFHRVQILDPATGTGTFLYSVIQQIRQRFRQNSGLWPGYVATHLLPRLYGFELLIAPYAVAHMKLGIELRESGYEFESDERLRVYLTNSLEEPHALVGLPLFAKAIAEEAASAGDVKKNVPIMVVLGNPPYSGFSQNPGEWIGKLVNDYKKEVDGRPLQEHRHWLNNDYVKFIRFAQWRVCQTGYGVVGFITDNSYLDGPTFRGMRASLMRDFDTIYILNLHGNSNRGERAPDGGVDENVFDIQQGTAIVLLIRKRDSKSGAARVYYTDQWGLREKKYQWLFEHDVNNSEWTQLDPLPPKLDFYPIDSELGAEYEKYTLRVSDAFKVHGLGIQSSRDHMITALSRTDLENQITQFVDESLSDDSVRDRFFPGKEVGKYAPGDTRQWDLSKARIALRQIDWKAQISTWLYRPFDERPLLFNAGMIDWPRPEISGHLNRPNLALLANRQTKEEFGVFIANTLVERKIAAVYDASTAFPLYVYREKETDLASTTDRDPNFTRGFIDLLQTKLKLELLQEGEGDLQSTVGPEDVLFYLYALFYSPTYRARYEQFLKTDFPRIAITSDLRLFSKLRVLGKRLASLHLVENYAKEVSQFPIPGSNKVTKILFVTDETRLIGQSPGGLPEIGRVYVNDEQYFGAVPTAVWNYHIGGYQVCEKWLKDRKGRLLAFEELQHYQRIVAALFETLKIEREIDATIEKWPIR